jgi:hypothetical protein
MSDYLFVGYTKHHAMAGYHTQLSRVSNANTIHLIK